METLYELDTQYQQVLSLLESTDDPQLIQDTLDSISGAIEDKAANYAVVLKQSDASLNMYDKEIKRLQAKRKQIKVNQDHMKQFLLNSMNLADVKKIESVRGNVRIQKNPVRLKIDDEAQVPDKYFEIKEVHELKRAVLKDALKNGADVKGAHLEQGESIRIS
ncbi:siphovirus Gp157 family protein [Furfurilactobacillus curtus]|uniref:Siphovirus Gp157 family protein n=1 Tax=Furfurilactobacillus curtus TaxID=1746200 RepID=A0ABQ5JLD8_9LACO